MSIKVLQRIVKLHNFVNFLKRIQDWGQCDFNKTFNRLFASFCNNLSFKFQYLIVAINSKKNTFCSRDMIKKIGNKCQRVVSIVNEEKFILINLLRAW